MSGISVKGDKALERAIRDLAFLTDRDAGAAIAKSQRSALKILQAATKAMLTPLAGLRFGFLRRAYVIRSGGRRRRLSNMIVGVSPKWFTGKDGRRYRPIRYAHLVEFGTRPHYQPKRGFMHPGARPVPHLRPAFESTKGSVIREHAQSLVLLIETEATRLRAKYGRLR